MAQARLFLLFAALYLLTMRGHYGGDGFLMYLTAESLVLDGDVAIDDRPLSVPEFAATLEDRRPTLIRGVDGRRYSPYGLGLALVEAPLYALGTLASRVGPLHLAPYVTMFVVSTANVWVSAALVVAAFALAWALGYRLAVALAGALLLGTSTMVWGYAGYGFSEPLYALTLVTALLALARLSGVGCQVSGVESRVSGSAAGAPGPWPLAPGTRRLGPGAWHLTPDPQPPTPMCANLGPGTAAPGADLTPCPPFLSASDAERGSRHPPPRVGLGSGTAGRGERSAP
ncbi:MAG: hypothetical protein HYY04_05630, partial [Chloroflexi bacterium]|nr:hypothetical protein [Chloroflexota bacterium]